KLRSVALPATTQSPWEDANGVCRWPIALAPSVWNYPDASVRAPWTAMQPMGRQSNLPEADALLAERRSWLSTAHCLLLPVRPDRAKQARVDVGCRWRWRWRTPDP